MGELDGRGPGAALPICPIEPRFKRRLKQVGAWYTIGLWLGVGAGAGILLSGVARAYAPVVAAPIAFAAGWFLEDWKHSVAAGAGAVIGGFAAAQIVGGALRRGGTRGGTALLVGTAGAAAAALSLIPVAGYLVVVAVALAAVRVRRREPERYAGLRTLAK